MIYPNTFQDEDTILPYLDNYNHRKNKKDQVIYQDMADTMMGFTIWQQIFLTSFCMCRWD